ncbi:MAG: phosphodiester glycosidase family protein [Bacteroidales bacterium]|jgi:exopolysaccharide biosynthesis protein|nr:phosphodiester glycosidase family protein [Bacteroidales bacterium]
MKKNTILLFLIGVLLLPAAVSRAQEQNPSLVHDADSLVFVNGDWESRLLHFGGITLRQCAFRDSSLFHSNQFISVLVIRNSFRFDILADTTLVLTSDFVEYAEALAGINGSFFAWDAPWKSVNYLRVDGNELAPNRVLQDGNRTFRQSGCIAVSDKGRLSIHALPQHVMDTYDQDLWEKELTAEDIISSGPVLREAGKDVPVIDNAFNKARHPRTAVGIRRGGRVLMVVVDGRAAEAAGMTMQELQHVLRWLRAWDAINLDGGGSSTLCVRKNSRQPVSVVNHPSDNKLFDNQGERRVANVLVVK